MKKVDIGPQFTDLFSCMYIYHMFKKENETSAEIKEDSPKKNERRTADRFLISKVH